jgi:hypothetical protein
VVVGGLAVNAWGVVRGTKDVDVVVDSDIENLKRVAEVAIGAGGHVQQGEAPRGSPTSIAAALANGEQVAIETDLGRLDAFRGWTAFRDTTSFAREPAERKSSESRFSFARSRI